MTRLKFFSMAVLLWMVIWPGQAMAGIRISRAEWQAAKQELKVRVDGASGGDSLQVLYNGTVYSMESEKGGTRGELAVSPVCYSETLTVESDSGTSVTGTVADRNGAGADFACSDAAPTCPDADGDGFADAACGGTDCNDADPTIYPGADEICGDGVDQSCSGSPDLACSGSPHANLSYADYPANCLSCHGDKASEVMGSTHYRWLGDAPDMVNAAHLQQGKLTNAVNSYCISILGDWPVCGSCHVGRGKRPDEAPADATNVDCLVCHSESYATQRTRLPDGSLGVSAPTDAMVRAVSAPNRANCLSCHAKAGGGDAVKRGDFSLATVDNTNANFDVHMNGGGANLACQDCHTFKEHKVIGKGSDLRPTDDPARGSEVACTKCHPSKDQPGGHSNESIGTHVQRVACQTCHIPVFAKTATEVHRDWTRHHDGSPADGASGPGHPFTEKMANMIPEYGFWNRLSNNALLGEDASETYDADFDTYPTSRPMGSVADANSKLYPFKYKTAYQPITRSDRRLIALDTFEYLKGSGDVSAAIANGLVNMGYPASEPYDWVTTDTYQLLNHGVDPASGALSCTECHQSSTQIDLQGLGYALKADSSSLCVQCHDRKENKSFETLHSKHVKDKNYDCSWCHGFSRPERGLRLP